MKVFILVAGLGTRIRGLFPDVPKCLVPINGKPFLEWQIEHLMKQGFQDFVLCVGYRKEQVKEYFKNGAELGAGIQYSEETAPQGTGSTLRNAAAFFNDTSIVLNGDTYLPIDYRKFVESHRENASVGAVGSIALSRREENESGGRVVMDDDGRISAFLEKQPMPRGGGLVNAGAYVLEPEITDIIAGTPSSLEHDVFPALCKEGRLYGVEVGRGFVDMGTPEGYAKLGSLLT